MPYSCNKHRASVEFKNDIKNIAQEAGALSNEVSLTMFKNEQNIVTVDGVPGTEQTSLPESSSVVLFRDGII